MPGDIVPHAGLTVPQGWVICWGQVIANAQTLYPALWAEASPLLRVGSGIRVPDLRGRVPMGAGEGTGLTIRNVGDLVGSELATLTTANLPAHNHSGTTNANDRSLNHKHNTPFNNLLGNNPSGDDYNFKVAGTGNPVESTYITETSAPNTDAALNHLHSFTTNNTGSGTGHPNVQPSVVVNYKMKI